MQGRGSHRPVAGQRLLSNAPGDDLVELLEVSVLLQVGQPFLYSRAHICWKTTEQHWQAEPGRACMNTVAAHPGDRLVACDSKDLGVHSLQH